MSQAPAVDALKVISSIVLERSSPVPLYHQVSQQLEHAIVSGALPPGTLFENEIQLADQFGISRPTMRRAMEHLVDNGLIVRKRGIGTRVVQPKVRRPLELSSLFDDLTRTGEQPTTELLDLETIEADAELAHKLGIPEGSAVTHLARLRSARGEPIAKMTNYLPASLIEFEPADLEQRGLYSLLRSAGIVLHSATQTIGARSALAAEARLLNEPSKAALLTMQRVTYDDHGTVVEYGTHIYSASRYTFEINLLAT